MNSGYYVHCWELFPFMVSCKVEMRKTNLCPLLLLYDAERQFQSLFCHWPFNINIKLWIPIFFLMSSEENRFNETETSQQTEAEPAFYSSFGPWAAMWLPKSSLLPLCWGLPLCQDWFHLTLGVTLLNQGKEIGVFREWLIWPTLDVIFSLRRITPLIQTCFTLW